MFHLMLILRSPIKSSEMDLVTLKVWKMNLAKEVPGQRSELAFNPGVLLTSHASLGQLLRLSDSPLGSRGSACRIWRGE